MYVGGVYVAERAVGPFTAIVQGVLCAGASVYVNQMVKQGGVGDILTNF